MLAKENIFREYDIRGIVGKDFDASLALNLGRAYGVFAARMLERSADSLQIAVGRDVRLTSEELFAAFTDGLLQSGVTVVDCGVGPTPQLYYSVYSQSFDGGVQITASHNPGDYNGFKMMVGLQTLSGTLIQDLKNLVYEADRGNLSLATTAGALNEFDAHTAYIAELISRSKDHIGPRKLKVVVDAGNGVGGLVGPEVLRALGCEVVELYTEPDGTFPNHHPDPTELENIEELRHRVVSEKADFGIGWDGDADRIGVVDEKGQPIFGDMLLVIYGRELLKEVKKPIIIGDVKCSELLFSDLSARGAETVMSRTGHSLIKAKIKELGAHLAGEMSGHMFFVHRYYGFDDALHAAARLVEIVSNTDQSVSGLLADLPKVVNTPELRLDVPEEIKFQIVAEAQKVFSDYKVNTIDGIRVTFPHGWGLVRASNTQSALVMRFEAETSEQLEEYRELFTSRINDIRQKLAS